MLAAAVAVTVASQFFRASTSAIGPELIHDLGLSPQELGLANAAFFIALLVAQVPIGVLFDRLGPRRVVTALMVMTVLGALLHTLAESKGAFIAARLLVGLGCSGSFMAAIVLCSHWYRGPRFATMLSRVFALSGIGYLVAGSPWAAFVAWLGWRAAFAVAALLAAVTALGFLRLVRDRPREEPALRPDGLREVLAGYRAICATPGLIPILAMHFIAYAAFLTVFGIWAGLYLNDVYGLGAVDRGNVLLAMGATQILGTLSYGPADRWFARRAVVEMGAAFSIALLAPLAFLPHPWIGMAVALLVAFSGVSSFSVVNVADANSRFPPHLAGRGATAVNLFQVVGTAVLPILTGTIIGLFPASDTVRPASAYQLALAAIIVSLAAGLAIYWAFYRVPIDRRTK